MTVLAPAVLAEAAMQVACIAGSKTPVGNASRRIICCCMAAERIAV